MDYTTQTASLSEHDTKMLISTLRTDIRQNAIIIMAKISSVNGTEGAS